MRTVSILIVVASASLLGACRRAPSASPDVDVQRALRQALQVPAPESARLTTNPPVGPTTDDGSRLSYGMRLMNDDDVKVQPFVQAYLGRMESDLEGAIPLLDEALEVVPDHEDVLSLKAMARIRQGRPDEAVALFRRILARHDNVQAPVYVTLGGVLGDQGQLDEALEIAEQGLQAWPRHGRLMALKGTLLTLDGSTSEAIRHLEQAHRLHPSDPTVHLALARAYAAGGHHVFAMQHAELALWRTDDPDQRASASALVARSLSDNVHIQGDRMAVTLVPVSPTEASVDALSDGRATWDVRVEIGTVLALSVEEVPPSSAADRLDWLARLRAMSTRLVVAADPSRPVHPVGAMHVRADLQGCAIGYHATVLGLHDGSFERWIDGHTAQAEALLACGQQGLFDSDALFQDARGLDLSRAAWGVPLADDPD